jgi:biotin carboxyl carrier protein
MMKHAISCLGFLLLSSAPLAHEGENHGEPAVTAPRPPASNTLLPERAERFADGSLFVPKPLQRQLDIRTQAISNVPAPQTITLAGHLIAASNAAGVVQASQPGQLQAPAGGLPGVGQQVKQGQILGWLLPQPNAADGASIDAGLAEAIGKKRQAEQDLQRLTDLRPHVSQQQLDLLRIDIDTQQQKILAYRQARARQALKAPLSGVISSSKAAAGQIVDLRDILFEIVDPSQLWLEVTSFDPDLPRQILAAHASTSDGRQIKLQLLGSSGVLRDQARPMIFRLQGQQHDLAIGTRVDVQIHVRSAQNGALLPASAISRDNSGNRVVWLHQQAEQFVPLRVSPQATHDGRLLVSGLPQGARIVVRGAGLLAQMR